MRAIFRLEPGIDNRASLAGQQTRVATEIRYRSKRQDVGVDRVRDEYGVDGWIGRWSYDTAVLEMSRFLGA